MGFSIKKQSRGIAVDTSRLLLDFVGDYWVTTVTLAFKASVFILRWPLYLAVWATAIATVILPVR